MKVTATPLTGIDLVQRAASITAHGAEVQSGINVWARTEHSPLRAYIWWVEMYGIPYRASVHLVRHKHGVEHYVSTTRPDLAPDGGEDSKSAPVDHGMLINAQAFINLSRKRLCYKPHPDTVHVMRQIRRAVARIDDEFARWMRPECAYRGECPEIYECRPGAERVMAMYGRER